MKRPNIIIVIKSERERAEFLEAGVEIPRGKMTADGELVSFHIAEDDPQWQRLSPLLRKRMVAQAADVALKKPSFDKEARVSAKATPSSNVERLDGYSVQTIEQLLSLEGKYRIDSLVLALEQAINQKAVREGTHGLTDEERIVLSVEWNVK